MLKAPSRPDIPIASPPPITLGPIPSYSPPALVIPAMPAGLNIDDLLSDLDVGDMGDIPDAPVSIPIQIPEAPSMAAIPVPDRPNIDTTVELPDAPTITMPDMEALEQINIPDFVFPDLPTFDATPPDASGILVPDVFINWTEPAYTSEVLDDLKSQVRTMMAGRYWSSACHRRCFVLAHKRARQRRDRPSSSGSCGNMGIP